MVLLCLTFALAILTQTISAQANELAEPKILGGPRPIKDVFRNVKGSLTKTDVNDQVDIFKSYGCEHMAVLSNEASEPFLLWCSCGDQDIKEIYVIPDESFAFTFKPKRNGKSVFQCVLNYQTKWVTFAVYDEEALYSSPREDSYVYRYAVREDGVYFNNKHKIRTFFLSFDYSTDDYIDDDYFAHDDATVNVTTPRVPHPTNDFSKNDSLIRAPKAVRNHFNSIRGNTSGRNALYQAPKLITDRFNIIRANLSKQDLRTEIDDFANYDCERMVVLSNDAKNSFRVWCSSGDDSITEETVTVGRSLSFSFKPKHNGNSKFQCVLNYRSKWATFDVFNGKENGCTCTQQQNKYVNQFSIRHYGVYGENNNKIKSLFNGRNQYILWEGYYDFSETPYGKLWEGYVDDASDCMTVPWEMNDRAAAISVCNGQCVVAYEDFYCQGRRQVVQAYNTGCRHVKLLTGLYKDLSAVKGC